MEKCRRMKRQWCVKELDIFLTMKVFENTPAVLSLGKLCDENGYSYEWINGQKPHLMKNGIRIICKTENFVPIVVPGLSASSPSGSDPSTSRTLSRQESHCSTSSSSSSSSPTVGDTKTREREDRIESDISPVTVSTTVGERSGRPDVDQANKTPKTNRKEPQKEREDPLLKERGDPFYSEIPEWLQNSEKIWWMMKLLNTETLTPVLLMKYLKSPHSRDVRICVSTVFTLISLKTEIARSARGQKLQGHRAGDAMVEPYLVLKILVTW